MKRSELKQIIKEAVEETKNYALGYRQAQQNYYDDNIQTDFTGFSPEFQNGYKIGIRDARRHKWNDRITRILKALGQSLGATNIGSRN
jgi:hypothetical protein